MQRMALWRKTQVDEMSKTYGLKRILIAILLAAILLAVQYKRFACAAICPIICSHRLMELI